MNDLVQDANRVPLSITIYPGENGCLEVFDDHDGVDFLSIGEVVDLILTMQATVQATAQD